MPKLNGKLLTNKRNSSTQGLPPGKEDLAFNCPAISGDAVYNNTHPNERNAMKVPRLSGSARWINQGSVRANRYRRSRRDVPR
jgi:hypothetical protein